MIKDPMIGAALLLAVATGAHAAQAPSEANALYERRAFRVALCHMLQSTDTETVRKGLLAIRSGLSQNGVGYPETLPEVVHALRRMLVRRPDAELLTRRLACQILWRYKARFALPVLVEALDDDAMDWVFGPGGPEWYAGWRSADHALRQITHATPIDEPKQRSPIKGQREKVRDAWRKWYDGRLPKAAKKKPGFVDLTIRDRFVKLTWLLLSADGAGMWTGFDASPDHSADPFALSPAAAGKIAELVTKLEPLTPRTRVVGYKGNRDYQLVIRHSTGVREIYIGKAATTEPPPAVRDLLAALWKTRKRGEPVSVHVGFTETDGHLLEVRAREGRLTYLEVFQKAPGGGSSEGGCSREQFAQLAGTLMKTEQGRAGTTSAPHSIPAASLSSQHRRTTRR